MLKIPKVTFKTMENITKFIREAKDEEKKTEESQKLFEEFASEQPALMTAISHLSDNLGPSGCLTAAVLVWKAIKAECECSELQSFLMDDSSMKNEDKD